MVRFLPLIVVAATFAAAAAGPKAQVPWRSAEPGRAMTFPADHASHPEYRIEWWYYTGNLAARDGRRFGYQLTFFRVGVDPTPAGRSRWAVRDLFMAHLAITDVKQNRHLFAERVNRSGPGWAGAALDGYRVWNEDWSVMRATSGEHQLKAFDGDIGVDLQLREDRAPTLHGNDGYSQKGAAPGNASFYYSFTRMTTAGFIRVHGERIGVTGLSWMDHEFGTNFLEAGQRGWDWLGIQLDDGRDLMLYQLRRTDGSVDPHSSGTFVAAEGRAAPIRGFTLYPGRRWTSKTSGAIYPIAWTIDIPGIRASLTVSAVVESQELVTKESTGVSYWEGAIDVVGTLEGRAVKGRGYLEMTGYSGPITGSLFSAP